MKSLIISLIAVVAVGAQAAEKKSQYHCESLCMVVGGEDRPYNSVATSDVVASFGETEYKAFNNMVRTCRILAAGMNLRSTNVVIATTETALKYRHNGEALLERYTEANIENTCKKLN